MLGFLACLDQHICISSGEVIAMYNSLVRGMEFCSALYLICPSKYSFTSLTLIHDMFTLMLCEVRIAKFESRFCYVHFSKYEVLNC